MTKQTQEALKMAYDWLNEYAPTEVVEACKKALEQPAQEPVAWVKDNLICPENNYETTRTEEHPKDLGWTPLYISQQARLLQEPIAVCKDSIVNWVNGKAIDGWLYTHPAPQPAQGEVVVTKNEAGQIVMVSRQDSEGNILSVIAESENA